MFPASRLDAVLGLPGARPYSAPSRPQSPILLAFSTAALCSALVWIGERWQLSLADTTTALAGFAGSGSGSTGVELHAGMVLLKLSAAALIGLLITAVHRQTHRDRPLNRSMEHAQTLLCVSGAMMMIIIGNSLARAFGIAGAAAIIRFRTPVDDPRDTTILFLLLALGMASGIGALSLAGLGTACLCILLPLLDRFGQPAPRTIALDCTAADSQFPSAAVQAIFARHGVAAEVREVVQGTTSRVKYHATFKRDVSLEDLTQELVRDAGLTSLAWDVRKRG